MLKGKRVTLRSIRKSDLNNFLKWFNDPEIVQTMYKFFPISETREEKWIKKVILSSGEKDAIFVIEIRRKGRLFAIGSCGINRINWKDRNAEIGIAIGEKDCQGKGYGTEALSLLLEYSFKQLNLHRIWAAIFEFNNKKIPLFEKIGFKKEGCLRSAIFKNGVYWDINILGLLENEWQT